MRRSRKGNKIHVRPDDQSPQRRNSTLGSIKHSCVTLLPASDSTHVPFRSVRLSDDASYNDRLPHSALAHQSPLGTRQDLPPLLRADGAACAATLGLASRIPEARGILLNSFESLEPRAVRALRDGLFVSGRATPPVYCIGPLVSGGDGEKDGHGGGCLRWMDAQPDRSVVFLCFGSMGAFPKRELDEIAVGLESSGQRFLWVESSADDLDLDALLPAGFLERTRDRGLVVRDWAPQVAVLRHREAGAFVIHCGWNSMLEGVMAGLPLLCWPLYAEQGLNKVFVVEEMRLGVEVTKSRAGDEDEEEEVEAKVRWVMEDSDGGARALREQ